MTDRILDDDLDDEPEDWPEEPPDEEDPDFDCGSCTIEICHYCGWCHSCCWVQVLEYGCPAGQPQVGDHRLRVSEGL